ncbi:MAG: hypothetical protein JKX82_00560 [Oleispira sp.]|nr:hypothetical protein [Oleispira sp.]
MNFKSYDVLSKLITGLLVSCVLIKVYFPITDFSNFGDVIFVTALAYIVGFFIDTFSSWLEPLYFFSWGGKPSDKFMSEKGMWGIKVPSNMEPIKNYIRSLVDDDTILDEELFGIALRKTKSDRIMDFQNLYAFSRSLLTSFIILFFSLIPHFHCHLMFYLISAFLIFVLWLRAKQRAYYFVKEVLVSSYVNRKE